MQHTEAWNVINGIQHFSTPESETQSGVDSDWWFRSLKAGQIWLTPIIKI